jgi:hypothetical protein
MRRRGSTRVAIFSDVSTALISLRIILSLATFN